MSLGKEGNCSVKYRAVIQHSFRSRKTAKYFLKLMLDFKNKLFLVFCKDLDQTYFEIISDTFKEGFQGFFKKFETGKNTPHLYNEL